MPKKFPTAFTQAPKQSSGFSIGLGETRKQQYFRVNVSANAQEQVFGRLLSPETEGLRIVVNNDKGTNHLAHLEAAPLSEEGSQPLSANVRNGVSVKLVPWTKVAEGKRPSEELPIVANSDDGKVAVRLPNWAQIPCPKIGENTPLMGG